MFDARKKTDDVKKGAGDSFRFSVMPKDFRGKEGLVRPVVLRVEDRKKVVLPEVRLEAAKVPVVEKTPEATETDKGAVKSVTPEGARKDFEIPPVSRRRASCVIVFGGLLLLLSLIGFGVWALFFGEGDDDVSVSVVVDDSVLPVEKPEEPVAPPVEEPFDGNALPGRDFDSDGLTDVEEQLYGTNIKRPDTDKDGFLDGNEVFNLYHPNGSAPETLLDTGAVSILKPSGFGYSVHILKSWRADVRNDQGSVYVNAPSGEVFQVTQFDVSPDVSLSQWYDSIVDVGDREDLDPFRTKQGYIGMWTVNHLGAFVRLSDTKILSFSYVYGDIERIEYRLTFEMFINSLVSNSSEEL